MRTAFICRMAERFAAPATTQRDAHPIGRRPPPQRCARVAGLLSALFLTLSPGDAGAQPERVRDLVPKQEPAHGPIVLRLPASARIAAMANAGVASNDGDALLYNPGMLPVARGMAVSVQRYGSAGTAGAFANVTQLGSLSFGVGAQFVDWTAATGEPYREQVRGGGTALFRREGISASSSAFTMGVARTIKGLRLGASVKYAEDRIGTDHDGTVAADVGMYLPLGPANLAFTVQNLGAGTDLRGQPGTLPRRIGLGYGGGLVPLWEHWDLGAQMQVTLEHDLFLRPAGGVELGYVPIEGVSFIVRTGLRLPRERDESLVTGGLGVTVDRLSLDYAVEPFRDGRPVSHRIGLRVR
jgi:hypothetical protein